jgi:hypothetical protein
MAGQTSTAATTVSRLSFNLNSRASRLLIIIEIGGIYIFIGPGNFGELIIIGPTKKLEKTSIQNVNSKKNT